MIGHLTIETLITLLTIENNNINFIQLLDSIRNSCDVYININDHQVEYAAASASNGPQAKNKPSAGGFPFLLMIVC